MKKSSSELIKRTLDYLARKHPWFGAIVRNRKLAGLALCVYLALLIYTSWAIYQAPEGGWKEIIKSYSPLLFDLFVVFVFSIVFLVIRGYYLEEKSRIDSDLDPDPRFFMPITEANVKVSFVPDPFFERHSTVQAILDALPIDQSDFFMAHAGSLDIPKLTLRQLAKSKDTVQLCLGIASFKEFFFTHHFADYVLSRSSAKDSGAVETLRTVFAPLYERQYTDFFSSVTNSTQLTLLGYTPNTMGITGCVVLRCGQRTLFFMQRRGLHESAARGVYQLSYAGTISAYPNYAPEIGEISLDDIANDEFQDEFLEGEPGLLLKKLNAPYKHTHRLVGFCTNSQYLFQPELFVLTEILVDAPIVMDAFQHEFGARNNKGFLAIGSLAELQKHIVEKHLRIRPLCKVAIDRLYSEVLPKQ